MRRFDQGIDAPNIAFKKATRKTPDRVGNLLILLAGCAIATAALTLCVALFCWENHPAFQTAGLVGAVLICATMYWFFTNTQLWQTVETIEGHDLPAAAQAGQSTHFNLPSGPHTLKMGDIEIEPQLLIDWCDAAWNRRSLAFGVWERRFALPDGTKGRREYQAFRDELVKLQYAEEVGGNVGIRPKWSNPEAVTFIGGFAQIDASQGTPLLEA